ncbi:MAG TPA: DUF5989 family protein [Polyangia bacterium]|jgi:hypothetical protein|nr:DUF5989 family protein [Polyangia bacterium]
MAEDKQDAPKGRSRFEQVAKKNTSLAGEILGYLGKNKKWWLLPIVIVFVGIGVLVLLSTTAAAPFIYTFF